MKNILKKILLEMYEFCETLSSIIPGYSGRFIRRFFYKFTLASSGSKLIVSIRCRFQSPRNIHIGNECQINTGCILAANDSKDGSIQIGDNVLIGPYVMIHSGNHNYKDANITIDKQGHSFGGIVIQDDVWIGAKSIVLSGVIVAKGSVIAAGSIVTKDTEEYGVYAGVPARKIKSRK